MQLIQGQICADCRLWSKIFVNLDSSNKIKKTFSMIDLSVCKWIKFMHQPDPVGGYLFTTLAGEENE